MLIKDTEKTFNGKKVGYAVEENGYSIFLDGTLWITQYGEYSKLFVQDGSYEDNALAQIEELCTVPEENNINEQIADLENQIASLKSQLNDASV